jgi:hypothetical protein
MGIVITYKNSKFQLIYGTIRRELETKAKKNIKVNLSL